MPQTLERGNKAPGSAERFTRPLLLTPGQDFTGWLTGHVGRALLLAVTSASVLGVLFIFLFVVREAVPFLRERGVVEFIGSQAWHPQAGDHPEFGALALIVGSLYVTVGALLVAVPVGMLAAIFLAEIMPFQLRQLVKPVIEILAAIPSVAYGVFAVLVLAPWMQKHLGFPTGVNALNASLILAVMALPTIISVAEDSLSALGREVREASYGLGATRAETTLKVVLPGAHSGIVAAVILGMMRAIGETMVVWMASGNANQIPHPWWDVSQSIRTITATIAGEMGEVPVGSMHYQSLFALGLLLLVFTLVLNLVSEHFLARVRRMGGKA